MPANEQNQRAKVLKDAMDLTLALVFSCHGDVKCVSHWTTLLVRKNYKETNKSN